MFQAIDIQQKLINQRNKQTKSTDVLSWVNQIFKEFESTQQSVLERLSNSPIHKATNTFNCDEIDVHAIFHHSQIEKICVAYRLRFLDTKFFKGDYPDEVISKINQLEEKHNTILDGFKIIAPSKLFKLNDADDPLLFAPMGNGYYYLIHKWGLDLHPFRKVKYWAIKNVENLLFTVFMSSVLFTALTLNFFTNNQPNFGYTIVLFLFFFKGIIAMIFFYGVASGKILALIVGKVNTIKFLKAALASSKSL